MATEQDKINSGALATLVAVSTFAMIGVSLAVTALTRQELGIAHAEREDQGGNEVRQMYREQGAKLQSGVPIEEAMKRVAGKLAQDPNSATPPGPAVPIPTAGGAGGAAGAVVGAGSGGASAGGAGGSGGGAAGVAGVGGAAGAGGANASSAKPVGATAPSASPVRAPSTPALPSPTGARGSTAPIQ